jgi:hypothetical protein
VGEIKRETAETPSVRPSHYKSWVRSEMLDPGVEDTRWKFALGPDGAVRDIEMAEDLLEAALSLIDHLPSLCSSQARSGGLTPEVENQMIDNVRQVASALSSGQYVTLSHFKAWDRIMTRCGVKRRVLDIPTIAEERQRLGVNIDFIEEHPSGEAWDRIEQYDKSLVKNGGWDISRRFGVDE